MQRPMRTSRQGLDLIKSFEGFRARSAALGNGRWIVGYGHTRTARDGLEISEADAAKILRHYDLPPIEAAIHRLVLATIHQNQFDALASFAFNLGLDAFRTSDVLAHVNAGEPLKAACAMGAWRRARVNGRTITIDALVRRRAMERALFLESPRGRPLAPSPIIRPERDPRIAETVLHETPAQIDTSGPAPRIVSGDTGAPNPAPAERTSEDIAKRIGERVTRILNESPGVPPDRAPDRPSPSAPAATEPAASAPALRQPAPPTPATPPPSADDIAAAVAALADPQPDPDQTNSGPDPSDLPPPPKLTTPPSRSGLVIDDLEPGQRGEPYVFGIKGLRGHS
ncbi:MAG: lysozyme, partial [Pseudomonadota bacterium]